MPLYNSSDSIII